MLKMLISGLFLFIMSLLFMFFSMNMLMYNKILILEWMIFNINSMKMNFILVISFKLFLFVFLVLLVSSMIFMYSVSYMDLNNEFYVNRFYYLMLMFLLSMIFLILSPNMLTLLLGWDGLGLISYCLIIYYQKKLSFNSGMLTVILNRLGDSSLLMIMSFMIMFGSWNLYFYNMNLFMLLMYFLMVFTKSAQLIFMVWLPAAMMAPTPVSSLVHSSTLVTAGIYLLISYEMMIDFSSKVWVLMISSITMFISGIMANLEMDFKKIIALSTLSQLGFMMSIYSLGMTDLTFLHLFIHAFFKSMMFMCAGSLIHYMLGIQNFRLYMGMFYLYPMKVLMLMLSLFMLCGFPFLVGFYSKDLIIEYYFLNMMSGFSLMNLIMGTIFTVSYSFRIMMIMLKLGYFMNLINFKEDFVMIFSMFIMLLIMLNLSKFVFNMFFFEMNINLIIIYKYFIFKMMLIGMMISLIMMENFIDKKMILFIISFFMMDFFYKFVINKMMNELLFYEFYFEKGLLEKFSGKIMDFVNYALELLLQYSLYSIKDLLLMYMFMMILMFILLLLI
uniref:NADH:ubiquinone reductase (H(+)-translocating) n=1 Tax=Bombus hortorum TaxID=85660 RepID=A0A0S2LSU0_BOMHO|nr:NADH dehydrogenase subunit 5 [Bombus hortorum]DBA43930.1 TPA_asm: ND5 [Bombus hortorum]